MLQTVTCEGTQRAPHSRLWWTTEAFTTGLNVVAVLAALVFAGLAVLAAVVLRHIPPIGATPGDGACSALGEAGQPIQAG